jgi:uncharacterized protein YutE (UPF0331/DUF86 family)
MTPGTISKAVVTERTLWIRKMLQGLRSLPLASQGEFLAEDRNVAAAESYLRRALEALHDLGRHLLAKGFGQPATEYKAVASGLEQRQVLQKSEADLMRKMAGYRNRMVHFYSEITPGELYQICTAHLHEVEDLLEVLLTWLKDHQPE